MVIGLGDDVYRGLGGETSTTQADATRRLAR
jgi:hypothetical protein